MIRASREMKGMKDQDSVDDLPPWLQVKIRDLIVRAIILPSKVPS